MELFNLIFSFLSSKQLCKFHYILSGLFISLYTKGFCRPIEEGEPKEGDMEDDVAGTGMGEGEGKKDVSKELTEDLINAKEERQEEKDDQVEEQEDGVEMENDFKGEMFDKDKDPDAKEDEELGFLLSSFNYFKFIF